MGPRAVLKRIREDLPQAREALRELPGIVHYLSEQIAHGRNRPKMDVPELAQIRDQLRKQQRQRYWLAVGATAIVTGTLILTWGFLPAVGWTLIAAGIIAILVARPGA